MIPSIKVVIEFSKIDRSFMEKIRDNLYINNIRNKNNDIISLIKNRGLYHSNQEDKFTKDLYKSISDNILTFEGSNISNKIISGQLTSINHYNPYLNEMNKILTANIICDEAIIKNEHLILSFLMKNKTLPIAICTSESIFGKSGIKIEFIDYITAHDNKEMIFELEFDKAD